MSLARHTILLVEDDQNDAVLLQRTFSRLETAKPIQTLSTGEKAIQYLSGNGEYADRQVHPVPTLLFLDLKLPGISGFEVLDWIRQQARLSRLQIVVLTGSRKSLDIYRAYELGADSYLVKPVKPEDIASLAQSLNLSWLSLTEKNQADVTGSLLTASAASMSRPAP